MKIAVAHKQKSIMRRVHLWSKMFHAIMEEIILNGKDVKSIKFGMDREYLVAQIKCH